MVGSALTFWDRPNAPHKRQGRGAFARICLKMAGDASPYATRGPRPVRFMRLLGSTGAHDESEQHDRRTVRECRSWLLPDDFVVALP